jgi:hypothetical protein
MGCDDTTDRITREREKEHAMINMPTLKQIAANLVCITTKEVDVYFSYATCIAFRVDGQLFISENVWSGTTGKHLNMISTTATRLSHVAWLDAWEQYVECGVRAA